MANELMKTESNLLPSQTEFQMFQVMAKNAQDSGLYAGAGGQAKIFMILLAARELGIPPMQALNGSVWNIQGKIELSARCMNSMIRRAGHQMKITSTSTECVIIGKRCDTNEEHTETFTWAMAEKAGLTRGNVWQKYPEDMLYNRCMSRLARRLFPDVIAECYVQGEVSEAKEIERQEKQLPVAECEDVTPDTRMEQVQPDSNLVQPKVDSLQSLHLQEQFLLIDDECKKNMWGYLKEKHGVEEGDFDGIPESQLVVLMAGIKRNKEKNKAVK